MTSPNNAKIQRLNGKSIQQIVNVVRLRMYENPQRLKEEIIVENDFEIEKGETKLSKNKIRKLQFKVKQVKNVQKNKRGLKYLIKWKEYSRSMNSWEFEKNLQCD